MTPEIEKKIATLESLCRQLQSQNAALRSSKEIQKYESIIADLQSGYSASNTDLETLKSKFKYFLEEYDVREQHFATMIKSKDLELSLLQAKLDQQTLLTEQANVSYSELQSHYTNTETELRKQLALYVDKFKQVEDTLNKSNELFITFRKEMEGVIDG